HEVQRAVGQQSWFSESNCGRKIRNNTVAIDLTRIPVETGRKIDSEHISTVICPYVIDAAAGRADRIAQRRPRAEPKQAVENYERGCGTQVRFCRHRFLRGPQLVSGFFQEFDKNDAEISFATGGWRPAQNLGRSAAQVFKFLAHQSAAISFLKRKPDLNFPSEAS